MKLVATAMSLAALVTTFGQAPFTKITEGEIVNDGGRSAGCAWGDYNGDGLEDLFVANANGANNFLYRNNGDGTFAKVSAGPIVSDGGNSNSASWGDIDNDGDLDLFVTNGGGLPEPQESFLYRNNGDGSFAKVITGSIVTDNLQAIVSAWADYDNDGWLDLFAGVHGAEKNILYRNRGAEGFVRVTDNVVVNDSALGDPNGCSWGDYDNDGRVDLLVVNGGDAIRPLFFYRNMGAGAFMKVANDCMVMQRMIGIGSAWGDYDNDGFLDLFVTQASSNSQRRNRLYQNNGAGGFECITSETIAADTGFGTGCAWGDYDNDGFLDLFVCWQEGKDNHLYHNNGDGTFTRITSGSIVNDGGNSPACAWADYDNDGFLDLFVSNGAWVGDSGQDNFLYRNDGNSNRWLKIKLVGGSSNRAAIGAKIRVTTSSGGTQRRQMREISGGSGFASQNSLIAHFGLADASQADTVRIEWPSGTVQELQNVPANRFLTITERPRLEFAAAQPEGVPRIKVHGGAGFAYALDTSEDLTGWLPLRTNTSTGLTLEFQDGASANHPRRFYRARLVESQLKASSHSKQTNPITVHSESRP